MGRALLLLLTATLCVGEKKTSSLSVSSGSSLTLPTNCTFDPSKKYELQVDNQVIGTYFDNELVPRLQFSTRLQFDEEKCSFSLENLIEADSNVYTFIVMFEEKGKIIKLEEHFNVAVTGHITTASPMTQSPYHKDDNYGPMMTSESPMKNSTQHHDLYGFLAVLFSMDPPVAVLLMGIHQLLLWLVKKCIQKFPEVRPSCLHHVFELILGDPSQNAAISGFAFGEYFSLVFQLIATILFTVWNIIGQGHRGRVVWPILSGISLLVEMVMKYFERCCTCLPKTWRCPSYVMFLRPLLISGSIVVAFSLIYYDITAIWKMWYLVALLISVSIRVVLIFFFYCKVKNRNETNNNNCKTDPNPLL